jgi:hypothetical protein
VRDGQDREKLAAEANVVRMRLLRTVEQLDKKREHARTAVVAGGVVFAAVAVASLFAVHRAESAPARLRRERVRAIGRAWRHPERTARVYPPVLPHIARSLAVALISTILISPVRRVVASVLEQSSVGRRVAARLEGRLLGR